MTTSAQLDLLVRRLRKAAGHEAGGELLDQELLRRFTDARDEDAFAVLVQRHGPMVLGVCRSVLRTWHDAEDAFQATFLILARKAASIRRPGSLASWLYGVAYHVAVRARARAMRPQTREQRTSDMPSADPLLDMTGRELRQVLHEELQKLPEKYRAPLVLCYLEGKTQKEAARQLRWTTGTVRGRLDRGREQLRVRLAGRGLGLSVVTALLAPGASAAAVPAVLLDATVKTALLVAAGRTAGAISASVAGLMNGALRSMFATKVTIATMLCLAIALLGASISALAAGGSSAPLAEEKPARPPPKPANQPKPAANKQVHVDRYGDPLPVGALQRLGTTRMRHSWSVYGVTFSPDGRELISIGPAGSFKASLIAWDTATGKGRTLGHFQHHCARVTLVSLSSAKSKVLAIVIPDGADTIFLRDAATGKELRRITSPEYTISCMALSQDGKTLAMGGEKGVVHLWEVVTGKALRRLEGHRKGIRDVVFSPDGKIVASASVDETVRLWDAGTGKELGRAGPSGWRGSTAFSPDGKMLACGGKDKAILWDVATRKQIRTLQRLQEGVTSLAFSADSSCLVAGTADGTLAVWDVAGGKTLRQWNAHNHRVGLLRFAPDGKTFVSGSSDEGALRLWELASGKEVLPLAGHRGQASPMHFSADGEQLVTKGRDNTIRQWNLATGQERVLFHWPSRVWSERFDPSPNRKTFVTADFSDKTVHQWDAETDKEVRVLGKYSHPPWSFWLTHAFSPDSKVLAARAADGTVVLWNLMTGQELRRLKGHQDELVSLEFSPDGKTLASGATDTNGKGTKDYAVRLWDVFTGKELRHLDSYHNMGNLRFSPDGKLLATGGFNWGTQVDQGVCIWRVDNGRKICQIAGINAQGPLPGPKDFSLPALSPLAWSSDSRLLAVAYEMLGGDTKVIAYETATGKEARRFAGDPSSLVGAAFAPDGRTLATGCWDSTVLIWDLTGRLKNGRLQGSGLTAAVLDRHWTALAGAEANRAYAAIWSLAAAPATSVPFLEKHLHPTPDPDFKRIGQLVADLDNERFAVRKKATQDIEKLDTTAAPFLRKAFAGTVSPELRLRLQAVLAKLESKPLSPAELRQLRAVTALEQIGTPEARRLLKKLATGTAAAPSTRAAKSALDRLK